ncbi:MAG: hypothetical protein RhofKO_22650 [Rhodothermales bacterium]
MTIGSSSGIAQQYMTRVMETQGINPEHLERMQQAMGAAQSSGPSAFGPPAILDLSPESRMMGQLGSGMPQLSVDQLEHLQGIASQYDMGALTEESKAALETELRDAGLHPEQLRASPLGADQRGMLQSLFAEYEGQELTGALFEEIDAKLKDAGLHPEQLRTLR